MILQGNVNLQLKKESVLDLLVCCFCFISFFKAYSLQNCLYRYIIIKMNLLDQLATFCPNPVSISLLDPYFKENKDHTRLPRHHSVTSLCKIHDDRNAKSIDKIHTYTPLNKGEQKKKILMKLSKTLSNKARKHFFTFWVNLQFALKNKQTPNKQQLVSQACQKLSNFFNSYQIKYQQFQGLPKSFSKISSFSRMKNIERTLENALSPAIKRQKEEFLQMCQKQQKTRLKLQIFVNSLEIVVFNKIKINYFLFLQRISKKNQKLEKQEVVNISYCCRPLFEKKNFLPVITMENPFQAIVENQKNQKTFGKLKIDNAVQNTADICDNHIIFIQAPDFFRDAQKNYEENLCLTEPSQPLCRAKRCNSKQEHQSYSQFYNISSPRRQINLIDRQKTLKKQYSTPTHSSASTSSVFNVDEMRISKLQKKLFGNINMKENKRSANCQDWKTDRKALEQIICNINCSEKGKRNSTYESQIQKLQEKIEYYRQKASLRYKQKSKEFKTEYKQCLGKNEKYFFLNSIQKRSPQKQNLKLEQKILISLKGKRNTIATLGDQYSKAQISQKMHRQQKQSNKMLQKLRK